MENITSRNNEKIKLAAALRDSATLRRKNKMFLIEGVRLCEDANNSKVDIVQFFFTKKAKEKFAGIWSAVFNSSQESYEISEEISKKLSDTKAPQGMFCVCKTVDKILKEDKINTKGKYILLENMQDPSNLGAIARTAEALGAHGMILAGGCDLYNPKALRASMGAFFRLNVIDCGDLNAFLLKMKEKKMKVIVSTPDEKAFKINELDLSGGLICIVGNEGNGVTNETTALADVLATIPMGGRAESLNASTAAAILIWEMMRRGG